MKISIIAVGKMRASAHKQLFDDYLDRFNKTGRNLGLGPLRVIEIDDRKISGMTQEAQAISKSMPAKCMLITMDERGKVISSPEFATQLQNWAETSIPECAFVIGGADGIDPELRQQSALTISFGKMVWPHMLARVMLSEQLYRAATILSGSPYHRI